MIQIIHADAREGLRSLPDRSVQMCMCSPPYWALRSYQTDPQVWGGHPDCTHVWDEPMRLHKGGPVGKNTCMKRKGIKARLATKDIDCGQFCKVCGSWRGELGSEPTPKLFIEHLVEVFAEVYRVLRNDGTLFINIGDTYCTKPGGFHWDDKRPGAIKSGPNRRRHGNIKPKDLFGIPWMLAFALRDWGWYLRNECLWDKPNPTPESATDRFTRSHEQLFMFAKRGRYYFDRVAIQEKASPNTHGRGNGVHPKSPSTWQDGPGSQLGRHPKIKQHAQFSAATREMTETRNKRTVWRIPTYGYRGKHYAAYPPDLVVPCIMAGTSEKGACPTCGTPWNRIVDKVRVPTRPGAISKVHQADHELEYGNRDPERHITRLTTRGWEPGCKCEPAEPVPCVVLDPFLGSGTTLMVARLFGRSGIGIELSEEYVAQSEQRIFNPEAGVRPPDLPGQRTLFELEAQSRSD